MSMLHPYEDRKKLKWLGFYLSEHTAQINTQKSEQEHRIQGKPQMSETEINQCLQTAILKNQTLAIQLNQLVDNSYLPDKIGKITGQTEVGLYLDQTLISYEEIRNISLVEIKKWSALDP
ncbi:hypothetical protein [Enterococcus olivae]